jgi:GNAT superfamily N-acetyltransferase
MSENDIAIRRVIGRRQLRRFLRFAETVYRDDQLWVPPVLGQLLDRLDPKTGRFYRHGEAECFVALRGGRIQGTICVAQDIEMNRTTGANRGIFGFFECLEDYAVAATLFDTAVAWSRARGLSSLVGPFDLDYENGYGILIRGRDRSPPVFCGHTPAYYQELVERYGFVPARGDNLAFAADVSRERPEHRRLKRLADNVRRRRGFLIRGARLREWEEEARRVFQVINKALAHLPDYQPWMWEAFRETLGSLKDICDPDLVLIAEDDGQVIGWFPGVPNLNEALQRIGGVTWPWDYLRLAAAMQRRPACLAAKSLLVLPEYWRTGVGILLFDEMRVRARAKGYEWVDLSLTSERNPETPRIAERLGGREYKRYRVYRLSV